jgi:hypothetical protein
LIVSRGRAEAKASNDSGGSHTEQQMKAFVLSEPVTPADIGLPSQPSRSSSFGITGDRCRAIEGFIEALLPLHPLDHRQPERR